MAKGVTKIHQILEQNNKTLTNTTKILPKTTKVIYSQSLKIRETSLNPFSIAWAMWFNENR